MEEVLTGGHNDRITVRSCLLRISGFLVYNPTQILPISRHYAAMLEKFQQAQDMYEATVANGDGVKNCALIVPTLAMTAGIAIALNGILAVYEPSNRDLEAQSQVLFNCIISVARQSEQYLPLGASWMPISLEWAWVARDEKKSRRVIEATWERYWTPASRAPFAISSRFSGSFDKLRLDARANHCIDWNTTYTKRP